MAACVFMVRKRHEQAPKADAKEPPPIQIRVASVSQPDLANDTLSRIAIPSLHAAHHSAISGASTGSSKEYSSEIIFDEHGFRRGTKGNDDSAPAIHYQLSVDEQRYRERHESKYEEDILAVRSWLQEEVRLPQYFDVFVSNGYETLGIIKEIVDENDLVEIGIMLKGHQKKILLEVQRLNGQRDQSGANAYTVPMSEVEGGAQTAGREGR